MKLNAPTYFELTRKLLAYRRKKLRVAGFSALFNIIAVLLPLLLMFVFGELYFEPSRSGRIISLVVFGVLGLALIWRFTKTLVPQLFTPVRSLLIQTAVEVGSHYRGVNDRLANALQIYENYERDCKRYSPALIEASLLQTAQELQRERFIDHVDLQPMRVSLRRAAVVFSLVGALCIGFRQPLSGAWFRFFHPSHSIDGRYALQFVVRPGDFSSLKGEPVSLRAWASDSSLRAVELTLRRDAATEVIRLIKADDDTFRHHLEAVRDTIGYFFIAENQRSALYRLTPIERPFLRTLRVQVQPPAYSRQKNYFLDDNIGDVSALKGSRINLSATANKPLSGGRIVFADSASLPLQIDGRKLSAVLTLSRDDQYRFSFHDEQGHENEAPILYRLSVVPDIRPIVQIVLPGKDIDLGDDMTIPLVIEARDDYGISRLRLAYQLISAGEGEIDSTRFAFSEISGFEVNSEQVRLALRWNLGEFDMFPTDVIVYYVEAFDNDTVSGPKRGRSPVFRARFPSMYEMYQEIAQGQDSAAEELEEALQRSRELQRKAEQLALEMKRAQELDWQKKNELENVLQTQQEINQQIDDIAQKMDEMIEAIEKNELFSQETLKKFEEIRQLYEQVMTPELKDALNKMQEALQNLDEDLVRQAMEELKINMQEYNQALDRTISLLKKLKAEQKLDQAQRMAQDLAERQQKITEQSQKNVDADRLQKQQQQINHDTEALADLMKEINNELNSLSLPPLEPLEQALQQMQQDNLSQNLQQLESMMQQQKMAGVPQKSEQAEQTFQKIAENLQQANQMMSGEMQRRALQALRKGSRDLLSLSQQQEELMQTTDRLPRTGAQFPEIAERQQEIGAGLSRVIDEMTQAMKNNFGINPKTASSLGRAMNQMQQSLQELQEREGRGAARSQAGAMSAMNEAVRQLQNSMQSMMQQGGSGGMSYQQFLQQMQQMGDAQAQINQQTQQMSAGGLSMGQQAAMARLAAEQQQLRKSMETLAREAAGMSEILGSMDKIAEDMKKVENDLAANHVTRDTINRQNRILSRMLDAQKSMNQREFSRERQAETGKHYSVLSPDGLPADRGERINQLQQDLLRAKKEGYTRDYLELIESYFKALAQHEAVAP